jgi:hypothetical protein
LEFGQEGFAQSPSVFLGLSGMLVDFFRFGII